MKELAIDIETYSPRDLNECGVYAYAADPAFQILLFAYSADGSPVVCVDLARGEKLPPEVLNALTDPETAKTAYNAAFERVCLSRWLGLDGYLDPAQWRCTMVDGARFGLPLGLQAVGDALGLEDGKMKEGAALIRYFCRPDTKGRQRHPDDAPDRWETFKAYNIRDVEVEMEIRRRVKGLPVPAFDRRLQEVDQLINDRGVLLDLTLTANAARMDEEYKAGLLARMQELTGLENPGSLVQLKGWIAQKGIRFDSLDKKGVADILARDIRADVREVLEAKSEYAKTSNKKYAAALEAVCPDGRVRGLTQFYGAARTGRFSGRLIQLQNLPQNHMTDLDEARNVVRRGDLAELCMCYDRPTAVLSELIRTMLVAKPGHVFHVCDFSAIEARVIAWLAGESWLLEVFRRGGDVYCAAASQMFGVPVEKHGANAELRQKGKIATLALGYGGGVAALEAMGGSRMGLTAEEEAEIVALWRKTNKRIVKLWESVEKSAVAAIWDTRGAYEPRPGLQLGYRGGALLVRLPSGRMLRYHDAKVSEEVTRYGSKLNIEYKGSNQVTRKWESQRTYGGKLVENIVQAIARDILGEVLIKAEERGLPVVFHVHDEIVAEVPEGTPLALIESLFSEVPDWAQGLPLKGAAYETPYYIKD